jgi:hypothetical protein
MHVSTKITTANSQHIFLSARSTYLRLQHADFFFPPPPGFDYESYFNHSNGLKKPGAIYQLLVEGRELFVGVLVHHNSNDVSTGMEI